MRPAFSNALYYPTIDIEDSDWLKTAILFWDSISTIVPESIAHPYNQPDTQYLYDIGFLRPLYVNPNNKSVMGIEKDILDLLYSTEFIQAMHLPQAYSGIWNKEPVSEYDRNLDNLFRYGIYSDKMSIEIQYLLRQVTHSLADSEIHYFDKNFFYTYMIALASKLCEDHSLGMITNDIPSFKMGNTAKLGNPTIIRPEDRFRDNRPKDHQLEQGLLLDFIVKSLSISPDTTIPDIIRFKNYHQAELGRFRSQLAELTQSFDSSKPFDVLQQEIRDLYCNEFIPAFDELKNALKSSKIHFITNSILNIATISVSATGIYQALLGMSVGQALLGMIGISAIAHKISYNVDKKASLQKSPYSYLLSINHEWN